MTTVDARPELYAGPAYSLVPSCDSGACRSAVKLMREARLSESRDALVMTANEATRTCRCGTRLARDNPDDRCAACQQRLNEVVARAPEVPAGFWDAATLQEALSIRHMGKVCRAYRRHPFFVAEYGDGGIPQDVVAGWLGFSQSQISRAENGPPIINLNRLILWARGLRIPQH